MDTNRRAVMDLIEAFDSTPARNLDTLRILRANLPWVEGADTQEGERACIKQACIDFVMMKEEKGLPDDSPEVIEQLAVDAMFSVTNGIAELCNYPPETRGQLIAAAIAEAEREVAWEQSLEQMQRKASAAIESLGPRDKALVSIIIELWDTDATQETDFLNAIADIVRDTPVDTLRTNPLLEGLLRIYDKAKATPAA